MNLTALYRGADVAIEDARDSFAEAWRATAAASRELRRECACCGAEVRAIEAVGRPICAPCSRSFSS